MEVKNNKRGSIELYVGPMFSGKSTMLLRMANKYKSIGKKILAINNKKDIRYGYNKIITHDKISLDCIMVDNLHPWKFKTPVFQQNKSTKFVCFKTCKF